MPNDPDELDNLGWHEFPEGEGPEVLTGISIACRDGKHDECPGHGEHGGETTFCICSCHQIPAEA